MICSNIQKEQRGDGCSSRITAAVSQLRLRILRSAHLKGTDDITAWGGTRCHCWSVTTQQEVGVQGVKLSVRIERRRSVFRDPASSLTSLQATPSHLWSRSPGFSSWGVSSVPALARSSFAGASLGGCEPHSSSRLHCTSCFSLTAVALTSPPLDPRDLTVPHADSS